MLKFSLKQKIFSGYIILIVIILALGLAAFLSIQRLFVIQENLHSQTEGIADLYRLEADLSLLSSDLAVHGNLVDREVLARLNKRFSAAKESFGNYQAIDRRSVSADVLANTDEMIGDVDKEIKELSAELIQITALVNAGQTGSISAASQKIIEIVEDVTETDIGKLIEYQDQIIQNAQKNQQSIIGLSKLFIIFAIAVGLIAGILIGWFITSSVGHLLAQSLDRLVEGTSALIQSAGSSSKLSQQNTSLASEIAQGADRQAKEAGEISKVMSQMASAIHQASEATQEVSQVATRTSQMAQIGGEAGEKSTKSLVKIRDIVSTSSGMIKNLSARSTEIAGIIEVITSIAEQTNLLALNAAIEAARAGDAGRGFAVVADEVRKLAEEAQKSAAQIKEVIKNMQEQISDIVLSVDTGAKEVDVGAGVIDETLNTLQSITSAIQQVSSKIQEISASSQQQASSSEQISKTMESIVAVIDKNSWTSNEMKRSAEDQTRLSQTVQLWAEKLKNLSDDFFYIVGDAKHGRDGHFYADAEAHEIKEEA
ncbi:methyl-accepting chemotaxis protein [Patescibacteria group bacterium]|nr:MAG: methyl-accepting chemotaxis protein [Patescibacteria group bacterium]